MERPRKQRKLKHQAAPAPIPQALLVDNSAQVQVCLRAISFKWGLTEVPYVVASLKEFLGLPPRTIADVSKSGDLVTLRRVIALDQFEPADSILTCPGFRRWQFNEGMKNAIVADNLEMAKVLLESFPDLKASFGAVNLAAANGRGEILDLLFSRNATTVAPIEAGAGEDAVNDEAHADFGRSHALVGSALQHGHLELAQRLVPRVNKMPTASWITTAVKGGSLQAVKWVYGLQPHGDGIYSGAIDAAVKVDNVEMVRWLLEHFHWFVDMARLVSCGHFGTIAWLLSVYRSRCFGLDVAVSVAAGRGRLDMVRLLLHHNPTSGTTGAMDAAAGHGHLDLVQWLHENRADGCTSAAMDVAAENGHLEMLKWLHAHRKEGCTRNAMDSAATSGYLDVVKWLLKNRSEGCSPRAINFAAAGGHLEIVQWLTKCGKTCTTDAMDGAAGHGHLHVVKWLAMNRSEGCTTQAMDGAAKNGHLDIVQWLHCNRSEGCSDAAMGLAVKYGHLAIVRWLHTTMGATDVEAATLVGALELSHFSVVVYVSMECSGDLLGALSKLPQSALKFLDWMYSRYPVEFVTAFLERFQSKEDWAKLCLRFGVQHWQNFNHPPALRRIRIPRIIVPEIAAQRRLLREGRRRRGQELFALILGGRR